MSKKAYQKPQLLIHGDVEKITLAGNSKNSDRPNGSANDSNAYPYVK